ncbi:hypothetical protein Pst134EA_000942 [Puccinia striiformis f. sp. tritici]|uniref:hypothetical protein n=1 Tax=Puccinia striiformis f. sp. tritici TaxID=168172 RepID=UPI0020087768|nr:hypothetical protein Pst134EA_000942 [Puccinia striiformis f. sp. tritici]KAH9467131.1 hypothetical protein Pst134EB_002159 [Puccinia striiformis f. sp. tritici]KAH9473880.1 hypothetical protein Pst134EA_000942 [Puccinia striiformis f. sp. tritici]
MMKGQEYREYSSDSPEIISHQSLDTSSMQPTDRLFPPITRGSSVLHLFSLYEVNYYKLTDCYLPIIVYWIYPAFMTTISLISFHLYQILIQSKVTSISVSLVIS